MIRRRRGFTLLEMAMVLVVSGLMVGFLMKTVSTPAPSSDCRLATKAQLNYIQSQIEAFARSNNRLPMPAKRNVGVDDITYGREAIAADITQAAGVSFGALPFQALGIPSSYAGDCWGNKFTYAVTTALTTAADSGGFLDATVLGNITLKGDGGNTTNDKIAYAVISHGEDELGAVEINKRSASWCSGSANIAYTNCLANAATLVDATFNNGKDAGANYFDDLLIAAGKPQIIVEDTETTKLYCWGNNTNGKLGDGTTTTQNKPTAVDDTDEFILVASGSAHTCGLKADGVAYCWGDNSSGQLGDSTTVAKSVPTAAGTRVFSNIAVGASHSCALEPDGDAYCWGNNTSGQLGTGGATVSTPTPVTGGLKFITIAAGDNHTCAITAAGAVYCWGRNAMGQVGDGLGTYLDKTAPTLVDKGTIPVTGTSTAFVSLALGSNFTCGLTNNDQAYCWGSNGNGRLGRGGGPLPVRSDKPSTRVGALSFAVIAAGADHACAITTAGVAYCWGNNASGQLGDGGTTARNTPSTVVAGSHTFIGLSAGDSSTCALKLDGSVYCWGSNASSQLGNSGAASTSPVQATGSGTDPTIFTNLAAGGGSGTHHCALVEPDHSGRLSADSSLSATFMKTDSSVWIADDVYAPSPYYIKRADGSEGYVSTASGGALAPVFLKSDGTAKFWDSSTQVFINRHPGSAGELTGTWISLAVGYDFVAGVKTDGSLWRYAGTAAQQDAGPYRKVAAGFNSFCAIMRDSGVIKCQGPGDNYQLGTGSTANYSTPTPMYYNDYIWRDVAVGGGPMYTGCAIRFDGSLYCWGLNAYGEAGVGDKLQRTLPTRVGLMKWKRLDMPNGGTNGTTPFVCGLSLGNDGYCWGNNGHRNLGDGTTTEQLTPQRIPLNAKWLHVSTGRTGACGLTSAEQLYCWGSGWWNPWSAPPTPTLLNF